MDLFTIDEQFRRQEVIDKYESVIWTERYNDIGDVELHIQANRGTRALLYPGTRLVHARSDRVMEIEEVDDGESDDGQSTLVCKGKSLENLLEHRVVRKHITLNGGQAEWKISNTPPNIGWAMFNSVCKDNQENLGDLIPYLQPDLTRYPPGTIPLPSNVVEFTVENGSLLSQIKKVCQTYNMGFRLTSEMDKTKLYFDFFMGDDRTTQQTTYPPVIFSRSLDNLASPRDYTSRAKEKNVAYVFGKNGSLIVFPQNGDTTVQGFQRRVLYVDATDIDAAANSTALKDALTQRGLSALAENRAIRAFDGEISQTAYKYRTDYDLGDLVEMQDGSGLTNNMRVTEQIFVSDKEGERSYPTLTIDQLITPGSWLSWNGQETWENATGVWQDA